MSERLTGTGGDVVRLEVGDGIAVITLDNPPLNLVTNVLLGQLAGVLDAIDGEPNIHALILTGAGGHAFCVGSDMREFAQVASHARTSKLIPEHETWRRLASLPFPTIAAIEGHALGGGLELALCCDLRVASEQARIGLPEVSIGGLAAIATQRLTRMIGVAQTKRLILLGEVLTARQAFDLGVVTAVSATGSALADARGMASTIAEKGPVALRLAKQLIDCAFDLDLDAGLAQALDVSARLFSTRDLLEGASAFLDKRRPVFVGS